MSTKIYPGDPVPVPMPKVSEPSVTRGRETTRKPNKVETVVAGHLKRFDNASVQHGRDGNIKPCFSLTAARVKQENILYFGVHGDVTKLSLSDSDIDTLMDVLEDLQDARS
jgi:hypothetical protein